MLGETPSMKKERKAIETDHVCCEQIHTIKQKLQKMNQIVRLWTEKAIKGELVDSGVPLDQCDANLEIRVEFTHEYRGLIVQLIRFQGLRVESWRGTRRFYEGGLPGKQWPWWISQIPSQFATWQKAWCLESIERGNSQPGRDSDHHSPWLTFWLLTVFFTSWKDSLTPDISLQAPQFSRWLMNMIIRTWSRNLIWKLNNAQFPVQKMLMRNGG